jgi:hypothetical protein
MKKTLAVLALSALAFGALSATAAMADPPAPQSPIVWSGNGTNGGFCADVSTDTSLPAGTQSWLFILTSPSGSDWTLDASFAPGGPITPVSGTQMGNGAVHFTVTTAAGAQLLSAQATNGKTVSVLTVSHCSVNGETPPPTPGGTTEVEGEAVVRPAAAVLSAPGFTG